MTKEYSLRVEKNYCPDLLTWKELEYLINIRPLLSDNRVRVLNKKRYQWTNSSWSKDPNCWPSALLRSIMEETVCYLSDMSRCTKKVNDFAHKLEKEYSLSHDAHVYVCLNPNLDHPFGIHFDDNDNAIVQCEGITNFKVWDRVEGKNHSHLSMDKSPLVDVDMNPGDAIFIPRNFPHLATSKTRRLSVSFPCATTDSFEERGWVEF